MHAIGDHLLLVGEDEEGIVVAIAKAHRIRWVLDSDPQTVANTPESNPPGG